MRLLLDQTGRLHAQHTYSCSSLTVFSDTQDMMSIRKLRKITASTCVVHAVFLFDLKIISFTLTLFSVEYLCMH